MGVLSRDMPTRMAEVNAYYDLKEARLLQTDCPISVDAARQLCGLRTERREMLMAALNPNNALVLPDEYFS